MDSQNRPWIGHGSWILHRKSGWYGHKWWPFCSILVVGAFVPQYLTFSICLIIMFLFCFESSLLASFAQDYLIVDHLRFFLSIFWPDSSGMMRKVCYDQTSSFFMDAVVSMITFVYFVMHCTAEVWSVTMMLCKWCLLILLNNKGWYFFFWKKKSI